MRSRGWTGWGCEDMKRTALYLDDQLWNSLHFRASAQGASISELVREAVRERYFGNLEERKEAMQAFIGIRKERADAPDSTKYVRALRRGRDREIVSKWTTLSQSDAAVLYSPVSVAELWAGARPAEHQVLDNLFRA